MKNSSRFRMLGTVAILNYAALGPVQAQEGTAEVTNGLDEEKKIASTSSCAKHKWNFRGRAPKSYIEGMGLVYAKAVCNPNRDVVQVVSEAVDRLSKPKDALAAYEKEFKDAKLSNDKAGVETLRHSYTLLIGLTRLRLRPTRHVRWGEFRRAGVVG